MRTAAATSGPASEPRPASSAPATKRVPYERSNLKSLAAWRRLRFTAARERRLGSWASAAGSEDADAVGRPVGEEGLADDPGAWDGSPEAAVVAVPTVVAHHEVV